MTITYTSSREYIQRIQESVHDGYGFVPFFGSGISAASGILMGQEFTNYLTWTVYRVLRNHWDVGHDGWPAYPTGAETKKARKWVQKRFGEICTRMGLQPIVDEQKVLQDIRPDPDTRQRVFGRDASTRLLTLSLTRPLVPQILLADQTLDDFQILDALRLLKSEEVARSFTSRRGYSPTSEEYILERGIRSLHDWRATLQFLAEVEIAVDKAGRKKLFLAETPDNSVIDSFNIHITHGRNGNLCHKMLAHLVRPLRVRVFLTTNFDSLMEDTLKMLNNPFEVIDVHANSPLPHPRTILAQNCIVKLHGGLLETRADYSLDTPPSEQDKSRFAEYLYPNPNAKGASWIPRRMLVVGYSASDLRCVQFIKYVLDRHSDFEIFWVCYNDADRKRAASLFEERRYRERVHIFQTDRPDLLLYELYQELELSLPGGGIAYEFTHKVPPEQYQDESTRLQRRIATCLVDRVWSKKETPLPRKLAKSISFHRIPVLTQPGEQTSQVNAWALNVESGLAEPMRVAFRELKRKNLNCMWVELQDYQTTEALLIDIFRVIALRLGFFQLEHAVLIPDTKFENNFREFDKSIRPYIKQLAQYFGIVPSEWVIFMYARAGAGSCAGWRNEYWEEDKYKAFQAYLSSLALLGFRIVYLPYTSIRAGRNEVREKFIDEEMHRFRHTVFRPDPLEVTTDSTSVDDSTERPGAEETKLLDQEREEFLVYSRTANPLASPHIDKIVCPETDKDSLVSLSRHHYEETIGVVTWWLGDSGDCDSRRARDCVHRKLQFLYAATLFRQSRHTSAFLSDGVYPCPERFNAEGVDNDWLRSTDVGKWIETLREFKIFYHKPGGYAWKYRDIRIGIQRLLESIGDVSVPSGSPQRFFDYPGQLRARTHFWIGDWYMKAFFSTGHYLPFIESLYHRYEAIQYVQFAKPSRLSLHTSFSQVVGYRLHLFQVCIMEMLKAVRVSRPWIKFWLYNPIEDPFFSETKKGSDWYSTVEGCLSAIETQIASVDWQCGAASDEKAYSRNAAYVRATLIPALSDELQSLNQSLRAEGGIYAGKCVTVPTIPGQVATERSKIQEILKLPRRDASQDPQATKDDPPLTFSAKALRSADPSWRGAFGAVVDDLEMGDLVKCLEEHEDVTSEFCVDGEQPEAEARRERKEAREASRRDLKHKLQQDVAKLKATWVLDHINPAPTEPDVAADSGQTKIRSLIEVMSEFAYLHVKRAKLLAHGYLPIDWHEQPSGAQGRDNPDGPTTMVLERLRRLWVQVCSLSFLTIDLCKNLDPMFLDFELSQKIKCHTLYGLALGHLERYFESHRHFSEADSILSKFQGATTSVDVAIINLRRAEVYLLEARQIRRLLPPAIDDKKVATDEKVATSEYSPRLCEWHPIHQDGEPDREALTRLHYSRLDDACVALESAENHLSGNSHSSLWWGRLISLRLRLYGEHRDARGEQLLGAGHQTLAYRRRVQHDAFVDRLFDRGILSSPEDSYRRLRLVDYYMRAVTKQGDRDGPRDIGDRAGQIKTMLKAVVKKVRKKDTTQSDRPDLLTSYAEKVKNGFDAYHENRKAIRRKRKASPK